MSVFQSFHEPGFWLVISILFGVALVAARQYAPQSWRDWMLVAYWVGIPYMALVIGAVSPRLMGLRALNWTASFQLGAGLILVIVFLAVIARLIVPAHDEGRTVAPDKGSLELSASLSLVGLAGAEELFWCFLRGAIWELLLTTPQSAQVPAYSAVWFAALLALPLTLFVHTDSALRLVTVVTLIVTSVIFFYTRNFWLCWLVHAALALLMASVPKRVHSSLPQ